LPAGRARYTIAREVTIMLDLESLRREMERIGGLMDAAGIPWAVAAGAAVYLYAGNRPPTDLDLLLPLDQMEVAGRLLGVSPKTEMAAWGEVSKLVLGDTELVGSLTVEAEGHSYVYRMDEEMIRRLRSLQFEGVSVPVLAPEDVIALKAILQRGPEQGKHDLEDIAALAADAPIDRDYLLSRLRRMGAEARARPVLERWGWL
jgi:hypothetical protein